jgi:hypothetical protein
MKKNILKKTGISLILIAFIEILLVISLTPSQSRLISAAEGSASSTETPSASWGCCPVMNNGAVCQDVVQGESNCQENIIPTKCEYTASCEPGCCIDFKEGLCSPQTSKVECEKNGGNWSNQKECNIQQCQKGCCVLGGNAEFTTEKRCEQLSFLEGFNKDFRDYSTEIDCLALAASQSEGACIKNNLCTLKTEAECSTIGGRFYENYLCSNPSLETNCLRQDSTGCVDEKDEIYWFDSCGNRENIYSSDKNDSWNNGMILQKSESCGSNSGNINSETCGNCNAFLSSTCSASTSSNKIEDGNYVCKDLSCVDENGKTRMNGESWCSYDGYVGNGKDSVGSRHWLMKCLDGEVTSEGCADYRGAICTQSDITEGGKNFSTASCVMNEALICLGYNKADGSVDKEACEGNEQCMVESVDVDSYFKFSKCVGKYPRGFDFANGERLDTSKSLCSYASNSCTVVYKKNALGQWKVQANGDCLNKEFTQKMNDFCVSMGDCGTYINYIGDGTNNINVKNAPKISWTDYKQYAEPIKGYYINLKNAGDLLLSKIFGVGGFSSSEDKLAKTVGLLGQISGGAGTLVAGVNYVGGGSYLYTAAYPALGYFAGAATGFAVGMAAGSYFAKLTGQENEGAMVMALAGGVAGAYLALNYVGYLAWNPYVIYAVIAIIIYTLITGWGKTKQVTVKFDCLPWQPPIGGENCKKCNEDPLKPCTEYRCSSLGTACKLINENSNNPACESAAYETNPPVITIGDNITQGYKFQNIQNKSVELRKDNGDCIDEFTPITFQLKTDEFAQCMYSFERAPTYEDMDGNYPVEQTLYTTNHTFAFKMPSLDSFSAYEVHGDLKEKFGKVDLFVKCMDVHGNFNIDDYDVNLCIHSRPDLTPVKHAYTTASPANNAKLKIGTKIVNANIWVNEPAECKYDTRSGIDYNAMSNQMECNTDLEGVELNGWKCNTNLSVSDGENNFYIKCKDQPWKEANDSSRNVNQQDYNYTLYVTKDSLKIDSIKFSFEGKSVDSGGTIVNGFEPVSLDIQVKTSGGADNGKAQCSWGVEPDKLTLFFETFSDMHKQTLTPRFGGEHINYIKCIDEAGNSADGIGNVTLNIDTSPPEIARIYNSGGNLKVITNEKAECYYELGRCNFDLKNGTSMTIGLSTEHTITNAKNQDYYIKCRDAFENTNPDCAAVIRPNY